MKALHVCNELGPRVVMLRSGAAAVEALPQRAIGTTVPPGAAEEVPNDGGQILQAFPPAAGAAHPVALGSYEPVTLSQDFRNFDFLSPWEGAEYILPGDEKAQPEAPGAPTPLKADEIKKP